MIFVTVGTQLAFDRLVDTCDKWALHNPRAELFMQVGKTSRPPRHCAWAATLAPDEWVRLMREARLVVSHAGMGTVISCLQYDKSLVVMPRRAALGEHRNDHQQATAKRLQAFDSIRVAADAAALWQVLSEPWPVEGGERTSKSAQRLQLLAALRHFVAQPLVEARR